MDTPATEVVENETTSRSGDIAAALDAHMETSAETPSSGDTPSVAKPTSSEAPAQASEKPAPATENEEQAAALTEKPDATEETPQGEQSTPAPVSLEKAPISWKPAVREHWKELPDSVKQEIFRRERDISKGLNEASEARRFHQEFHKVVQPYESVLRMEATSPIEGFQNYLRTAAVLRNGTQWEKANSLAGVIKQFQIDPVMLDQALVGQLPPQGQQRPEQFRDPRMDELLSNMASQREQQENELKYEAHTELEAFRATAPEFMADVEDYMADILQVAAQKGHILSLQQAYDRAIMVHPEVSDIVMQRRQQSSPQSQQQKVEAARRKALGTGSSPRIGSPPPEPNTIRGGIEAAIDKLSS